MHRRLATETESNNTLLPKERAGTFDFRRWARFAALAGIAWGQITLLLSVLTNPSPANWANLAAVETCGLLALLVYRLRRAWLPILAPAGLSRPQLLERASITGIAAALLLEGIAQGWQVILGQAAQFHLLTRLLLMLPWYAGMVVLFVHRQDRQRFPLSIVLLLGGLYRLGVDGILRGQVLPAVLQLPASSYTNWGVLFGQAVWQFIIVYALILVPAALIVFQAEAAPPAEPEQTLPEYEALVRPPPPAIDALKPLIWLFPYAIYLLVFMGWLLSRS